MLTHRDIIKTWPKLRDFAEDIGVSENTAKAMRTRNSINSVYWREVVSGAERRGYSDVTHKALAIAAEARARPDKQVSA